LWALATEALFPLLQILAGRSPGFLGCLGLGASDEVVDVGDAGEVGPRVGLALASGEVQ